MQTDMTPFTEIRPWGSFRRFISSNPETAVTVKILSINPHKRFSLQTHKKRSEFWRILSGQANITIGDKINVAGPGDEFVVPTSTEHRIEAGDKIVEVLEISTGEFDEQDIVRLRDDYGRTQEKN